MPTRQKTNIELSFKLKETLEEYLESIKEEIANRALDIASSKNPGENAESDEKPKVSISDLAKAIDEITPGYKEQKIQFFDLFPPFTCICAILCLAFATLGLLSPDGAGSAASVASAGNRAAGFLDIAKIFAGAIVGSTTSIALRATRAKGGR